MRHIPIIAICGEIGAGKDTVAKALAQELGYVTVAFADRLKDVAAQAFPWIPCEHFYGTQEQKAQTLFVANGQTWTGRKILEKIGQDLRDIHSGVWLLSLMMFIDETDGLFVIPGIRHPNEFEAVRARGGEVWEVRRLGGPPAERSDHVSDSAWRELRKDAVLSVRHGDLDSLRKMAVKLAQRES